MKKVERSATPRVLFAILLSFTFLLNLRPMTSSAGTTLSTLNLRSESQLRTEAGLYDAAIREISRVATMKLETIEDLKTANAILRKHAPNLAFSRPKLVVTGLGDPTFVGALRERTRDSKATDSFALDVARDPNSILKLNGASSLADRTVRSVEADIALLRKVVERLKKTSDDMRSKTTPHHSVSRKVLGVSSIVESGSADTGNNTRSFTPDFPNNRVVILIAIAVVAIPPFAMALTGPATRADGVLLSEALIIKINTNIGAEKGIDVVAECRDRAAENFSRCLEGQSVGPFVIVNETACLNHYLLDLAACMGL